MSQSRIISTTHDTRVGAEQSPVLASMRRHWVVVLLLTVLGGGSGILLTSVQPDTFQAESRVFLSSQTAFDPTGGQTFVSDPSRFVQEQAAVMSSTPVLEAAIAGGAPAGSVRELRDHVEVVPAKESGIVTVRASSVSQQDAIAMVDEIVLAYRNHVTAAVAATLDKIVDVLRPDRERYARRQAALFGDGVSLAEPAAAERTSSVVRNAVLLGLVGLLCSMGVSLLRDRVVVPPEPDVTPRSDGAQRAGLPGRRRIIGSASPPARSRADEQSPEAS